MYVINDQIRIIPLSDTLVRIEQKGPLGFEDRTTFHVLSRSFPEPASRIEEVINETRIVTENYQVVLPKESCDLKDIEILSARGDEKLALSESSLKHTPLPCPGKMPFAWVMADAPRVVPPPWGATAAPPEAADDIHSGWSIENDAPDVYVFIPGENGYERLRDEFLKLTGPTPLPPLYAFGLIYSRFYPYKQEEVIDRIDEFRRRSIPLEMFVVDTDWRIGASHGYETNDKLFPDMPGFFEEAHARDVRIMFNDHPEPQDENGLSAKEFQYRQNALHNLFEMGLDAWWYDRNWAVGLNPPLPGMRHDLWGMRLYHDLTQKFFPNQRPFVLSNTICVTDGKREDVFAPSEHRFPVWWTGDTGTDWHKLELAIGSAVDLGVTACLPYVSEDLAGFYGQPSAELFVRYLQFGAFSPIMRLHASPKATRYPWAYGENVESIVSSYIHLRYRLLPTIYSAAHTATLTGQPVLRRCDLYWPEFEEASRSLQYLLGDDLLVAPVTTPILSCQEPLPEGSLQTEHGEPGLDAVWYDNVGFLGTPVGSGVSPESRFTDSADSAFPDRSVHAIRWTGKLLPVEGPGHYIFVIKTNKNVKLLLDGQLQDLSRENKAGETTYSVELDFLENQSRAIKLELYGGEASFPCELSWVRKRTANSAARQDVWIPPGLWINLWSGSSIEGPKMQTIESPLERMPLFVRDGGLILTTRVGQNTGKMKWDDILIHAFVPQNDSEVKRYLYQDDTVSNAYKDGKFNRTTVTFSREGEMLILRIHATDQNIPDLGLNRRWTLRLYTQDGQSLEGLSVNGVNIPEPEIRTLGSDISKREMPLAEPGCPPTSGKVFEVVLPEVSEELTVGAGVIRDSYRQQACAYSQFC